MQSNEIAAYAAGIFDGEGYVGIDKTSVSSGKIRKIHHSIRVVISQKDGELMNWLKDNFGGNVYRQRNGDKYFIYRWRIHAEKADKFLRLILPYVVIKKNQVKFALDFNKERKQRVIDSGRSRSNGRFINMTDNDINWRIKQKEKLSAMKKVYAPYTRDSK